MMKKEKLVWIIKSLVLSSFIFQINGCEKDDIERIQFNKNLVYGTLTDIEGNVYKTIEIGTQTWMAENLRVTTLNDGSSSVSFEWPLNDPIAFKNTFGAKYNWNSVKTGKLCPVGWHVPSDNEWMVLTNYLGGDSIAGGKLKEAGTKHWSSPNLGATNESGFTALAIPICYGCAEGEMAFMWTSTEFNANFAWYRAFDKNSAAVYRNLDTKNIKHYSSVRCVRD